MGGGGLDFMDTLFKCYIGDHKKHDDAIYVSDGGEIMIFEIK